MSISTIGDLRQHFLATQNTSRLKTDLNTLVEELTTGEKSNLTEHLGTAQTELSGLNRQLSLLESYIQGNSQTSNMLSTLQTVLDHVDTERSSTSAALLTIDEASSSSQMTNVSQVATSSFKASINVLNTRYGDRSILSGTDVDEAPLASAETMLSSLQAAVSGLSDANSIANAVESWFDDSGGGFEIIGYQGDADGFMSRPLDGNQTVHIDARADDVAIRDVLKGLAMAHFAGDDSLSLDLSEQRKLLQMSATGLLSAAEPMAGFQSRVGFIEGDVEEASVRNLAEQTSYGIARSELISADPFETATKLEAVQLQLETQYTLTARLSGLSLTEYLR